MRHTLLSVIAVASSLVATAQAVTVNVNNYNWLQLPAAEVTTVFGSTNNAVGHGYGDGTEPRWGDAVWIPSGAMTASGTQMYYAAVRLDQPRNIENVHVQWWAAEGTSISQYFVDGSNDGVAWSNIGVHNFGSAQTGARFKQAVNVTDGTFQYVRVRVEPGDYTFGNAGRGGPGIYTIEPLGDGTLNKNQVNWVNQPNFATSVSNNGLGFNSTRYNDGLLFDDEGQRTGNNPGSWDPGDYAQIDLGARRLIDSTTVVWDAEHVPTNYNVEYSNDGSTFFPVPAASSPIQYSTYIAPGATEKQFSTVYARYLRITGATVTAGYGLLNQVLAHGPDDGVLTSNPGNGGTLELSEGTQSVTLTNSGGLDTAIAITGYSITGPDAAMFDLSSFSEEILTVGLDDSFTYDVEFSGSVGLDEFNALLTFTTTVGNVSFNLSVASVPEPATWLLFAPVLCGLMCYRRRLRA